MIGLSVLMSVQCGDMPIMVLPFLVYVGCAGTLLYHLLSINRIHVFRRSVRESIIQEVVFILLMNQAIKIWVQILYVIDFLVDLYWQQMALWFPTKGFIISYKEVPDLSDLPVIVQMILEPRCIKTMCCCFIAVLPLVFLHYIRKWSPVTYITIRIEEQYMERTELGSASYYLERPYVRSNIADATNISKRTSMGSIRSSLKLHPKKRSKSI